MAYSYNVPQGSPPSIPLNPPSTPLPLHPPPSPQVQAGALLLHMWTCHECGCGTFIRRPDSLAVCHFCTHAICIGCTSTFGARLLDYIDVDQLAHRRFTRGCICPPSSPHPHCELDRPIRRCPSTRALARRHEPYARPALVYHCLVAFCPAPDGRPQIGTYLYTRPRSATPARLRRSSPTTYRDEVRQCIANSVAVARDEAIAAAPRPPDNPSPSSAPPLFVVPPFLYMNYPPQPNDPPTAHPGFQADTLAAVRYFAGALPGLARDLKLEYPVFCVHVDPILAHYIKSVGVSPRAIFAGGETRANLA